MYDPTSGTTSQPKTHENLQISNATFGIFWEDWVNFLVNLLLPNLVVNYIYGGKNLPVLVSKFLRHF